MRYCRLAWHSLTGSHLACDRRLRMIGGWIGKGRGWFGYSHRIDLGAFGLLAYGGEAQKGTLHVELNAHACARIRDFNAVHLWGEIYGAIITRVDLAHDDLLGETINIGRALDWWEAGAFNASGRRVTQARRKDGVSSGNVNRTLSLLRAVLRVAANDWEWVERAPKVRLLAEPKGRVRYLTQDEARRLLVEMPEHLSSMVLIALLTGLRQRNVRELRWSQLDLSRKLLWVHPDEAKGRRGIPVPLTMDAAGILREQEGKHSEYVFTFRGEPIRWVNNTAWRSALKRAGIENFRWHDLRHTWATLHMQSGTPLHVLQQLGGWASAEMTKRYAHFTPGHLAGQVQAFAQQVRLLEPVVYDSATQEEAAIAQ